MIEHPHTVSSATETTRPDLERYITTAAARVLQSSEGIFGADSLSWRINRESALFLGAGRAALLQLAHPWVAAALDQHSTVMQKPIKRFHDTFRVVFTMIFGTAEQAFRAARSLFQLHTRITGEMPDAVAGYEKGSRYAALQVPALRWVYATLVDSGLIAYEAAMPRLKSEERAAYYEESKVLAGLFGVPAEALPADWNGFQSYMTAMLSSQALGVDDRARNMGQKIISGAGSWIPVPGWYRALTAEWLPERFREEFGMEFGAAQKAAARRAQEWLPRLYPAMPEPVRFVGPYQEALARLQLRMPGFAARRSNVFWIGQERMPFGE